MRAEEDEPQSVGVRAYKRSEEHDLGHERGNIEPAGGGAHKRLSSKTSSVSQSVGGDRQAGMWLREEGEDAPRQRSGRASHPTWKMVETEI